MNEQHVRFWSLSGAYPELSNFWRSSFELDGVVYKTVEHYFQSKKTLNAIDCSRIRSAKTPSKAKRLGRKCTLRKDWEEIKELVMLRALRAKFSKEGRCREVLLSTEDASLHEMSPYDMYWGYKGKNRLGALLEQVREELRDEDF